MSKYSFAADSQPNPSGYDYSPDSKPFIPKVLNGDDFDRRHPASITPLAGPSQLRTTASTPGLYHNFQNHVQNQLPSPPPHGHFFGMPGSGGPHMPMPAMMPPGSNPYGFLPSPTGHPAMMHEPPQTISPKASLAGPSWADPSETNSMSSRTAPLSPPTSYFSNNAMMAEPDVSPIHHTRNARASSSSTAAKRRSNSGDYSGESWGDEDDQPWGMPQDEYLKLTPKDKKQVRNR